MDSVVLTRRAVAKGVEPGTVAQQVAYGDIVGAVDGEIGSDDLVEPRFQRERALLDELHDGRGRHELERGTRVVVRLRRGGDTGSHIGVSAGVGPDDFAVPDERKRDGRDPGLVEDPLDLALEGGRDARQIRRVRPGRGDKGHQNVQ